MNPVSPSAPYISKQKVHFDMLDLLGIMHNALYLVLFERARTEFWNAIGYGWKEAEADWPYYVARNEINYRAPINTEMEVAVTVTVRALGNSSLTFAHTILLPDGTLAAEGKTVLVRVDNDAHRPMPWSDAFRARLAPYITPS